MKKLDKLILKSFIGPFFLTFFVVVFILLTQYMLKYFDEFVGKDLGFSVFAELIMYFSINMTPMALPLAILLSSLMTFGNLGEHFELTAIKSAGISLIRILLPLFIFACGLSVIAFYNNNYIVPKANLKAYSLLYDIKQTKPSLDLKEGAFYNGIPNYSIKVNEKYPDGITLGDLIIYDHTAGQGNTKVILADSGKMYPIHNNTYLMLELFKGNSYSEMASKGSRAGNNVIEDFHRNSFDESKIIFSLASFGLKETKEELFASNRLMKNASQLTDDLDSMQQSLKDLKYELYTNVNRYFSFHLKNQIQAPEELLPKKREDPDIESTNPQDTIKEKVKSTPLKKAASLAVRREKPSTEKKPLATREKADVPKPIWPDISKTWIDSSIIDSSIFIFHPNALETASLDSVTNKADSLLVQAPSIKINEDSLTWAKLDSVYHIPERQQKILSQALSQARYVKNNVSMQATRIKNLTKEVNTYIIEKNKKYAQAVACLVMFLIGAPLGAIIKKGGLGIPVIISIAFFIIFYVFSITGEKWGKESIIDPVLATWVANIILFPFGVIFLRQARNDVRVFESDFYKVLFDQLKSRLKDFRLSKLSNTKRT